MAVIILLRHFPTTDDIADIYTDEAGSPTLADIDQVTLSCVQKEFRQLVNIYPDLRFVASDNPRGYDTARAIASMLPEKQRWLYDKRINNIRQPEWAGLSQDVVRKTDIYKIWHTTPGRVAFAGGEKLSDVDERTASFLASYKNLDVAVVSHTTPMQIITCRLLGLPATSIWSFKFDHFRFSLFFNRILCRLNSETVSDFDLKSIRS